MEKATAAAVVIEINEICFTSTYQSQRECLKSIEKQISYTGTYTLTVSVADQHPHYGDPGYKKLKVGNYLYSLTC